LARTINLTFRTMLIDEYRRRGTTSYCHVYFMPTAEGASSYYFAPVAAHTLADFIRLWEGHKVQEPAKLAAMEIIL
jgi:hypothetical protein